MAKLRFSIHRLLVLLRLVDQQGGLAVLTVHRNYIIVICVPKTPNVDGVFNMNYVLIFLLFESVG